MTRCGFIAFLGTPNAGKSTLLNALVGQKLAIVTPKAQTTRHRITGAIMHEQAQLIFVDVPGVFEPPQSKRFERAMVACAWSGVADADVTAVLIDARKGLDEANTKLLERLSSMQPTKVILILNKIDLVAKDTLLALTAQCHAHVSFAETFYISALKGDGLAQLKDYFARAVPEGPPLYPEDHLTDMSERLLASEITREKLFMLLREELPYSISVETEHWEERADGSLKINQVIYVERESQKGIILGKGGVQLRKIGQMAREEIARLWGCPVHLFLFVKLRENWKTHPDSYRYLGLKP